MGRVSMRTSSRFSIAGLLLLASICGAIPEAAAVSANPSALSGRTNAGGGAGCAGCHGAAATTVAIAGPSALNPSQVGAYTVTATVSASSARMGAAIATSDVTMQLTVPAGQRLAVQGNELIHNANLG